MGPATRWWSWVFRLFCSPSRRWRPWYLREEHWPSIPSKRCAPSEVSAFQKPDSAAVSTVKLAQPLSCASVPHAVKAIRLRWAAGLLTLTAGAAELKSAMDRFQLQRIDRSTPTEPATRVPVAGKRVSPMGDVRQRSVLVALLLLIRLRRKIATSCLYLHAFTSHFHLQPVIGAIWLHVLG